MAPASIPACPSPARWRECWRASLAALYLGALPVLASAAAPPPQPAASQWLRLQHAGWVVQGASRPEHLIYVIADANCSFCHDLWLSLQPLYPRGLQVRYVLVGIIADDSPGKAAAIMEARNPAAALERNERQWARLPDDLGGGIPPLKAPQPATLAAIHANEELMHSLGVSGTPAIIYRSADHALHVVHSASDPGKLAALVSAATPD
jgi:thiol:disulfide interchange protein DsbG